MTATTQYHITGGSVEGITTSIEDGVVSGALPPGNALPSIRALAADLGVSPSTVAGAYRELRRRGVIVTHDRSKTVVSHRPPLRTRVRPELPPGVTDLGSGNPDPRLMPDLTEALQSLTPPPRRYGEAPAVPELTDRVRAWFERDGIDGELVVISGALDGLERALRVHLRVGDRVGLEDPGYTGMLDLVRALGLVPVPLGVDERGVLPDQLAAAAPSLDALLLSPRAQNPTSAAIDATRADELRAAIAPHPALLVIEDDHASDIAGAPHHPIAPGRERWAVVRSMTKLLAPDLRVGVLIGDDSTVNRVAGHQTLGPGWVSHVLQHLTLALWERADDDGLLDHARATYATRRGAVVDRLRSHGVAATGESGLNVWVPVAEETPVVQSLLQRGWVVTAGEAYRIDASPGLRVTVAELEAEDGVRFADDLAEVLRPAAVTRRG